MIRGTSLLTYWYIGKLRNRQKVKCENEPFIVLIYILTRVLSNIICFYYIFRTNGRWDEFDVKKHFREINNELFFRERGLAVTALGKVVGLNN